MAYTIHKSDGTVVTVADNTLDAAYYNGAGGSLGLGQGVQLVGRNTIDYGAAIAQNILQMTENFASGPTTLNVPSDATALQGQLWFNKTSGTAGNLYVRVSGATSGGILNWQQVITVDSTGNSTVNGNQTITGGLTVDGSITAEGGLHVPVVFTALPLVPPQVAQNGDMAVSSGTISIYTGVTFPSTNTAGWSQIFPALYQ